MSQVKTVILIGAGATLAAATAARLEETPEPPLDSTFFRLAAKQKLTGFPSVRRYMFRNHGMRLTKDSDISMEKVFNYIFSDVPFRRPERRRSGSYVVPDSDV